ATNGLRDGLSATWGAAEIPRNSTSWPLNDAFVASHSAQSPDRAARCHRHRAGVLRGVLSAVRRRRAFLRPGTPAAAHSALFPGLWRHRRLLLQPDDDQIA